MIARARAIAHGNAYTTYSTLKRDAEFICSENMAGDMTVAVTEDDLDSIWMQFKYARENYLSKGKPVTRNLIAMEVSPTKEESKGWTAEQWSLFAHRFIEEMDKIEFSDAAGDSVGERRGRNLVEVALVVDGRGLEQVKVDAAAVTEVEGYRCASHKVVLAAELRQQWEQFGLSVVEYLAMHIS